MWLSCCEVRGRRESALGRVALGTEWILHGCDFGCDSDVISDVKIYLQTGFVRKAKRNYGMRNYGRNYA